MRGVIISPCINCGRETPCPDFPNCTSKKTSSRVCDLCNPRDYRAMRALESLTPNGSEFVNDPEACVEYVRDRMAYTVQLAKERNALRRVIAALPLSSFGVDMSKHDAADFVDHSAEFFEAMKLAKEIQ